jgi:hypothetical protein
MRLGLDSLARDTIDAIQQEVPEYSRLGDEVHAQALLRSVGGALHHFIDRIADPATTQNGVAETFRQIGRKEAAAGRSLEPLQTALRVGARVSWQRLHLRVRQGVLDVELFARVGEAIFRYLDELADACADGFSQATAAGEIERRRKRLMYLIVSDPPASAEAVTGLARAAGWTLPRTVAAVALVDGSRDGLMPLPALPPEVLVDMTGPDPFLLMPDPDGPGRPTQLENGLRGWPAAAGPTVPLTRAGRSLRWARQALSLTERGVIGGKGGLVRCAEHLSTLVVLSDQQLVRQLGSHALAPLRYLRPDQRDRLAETLLAWLESADNAEAAAQRLHVHPQTVRYRLRQITELFGDSLRDPGTRFDLQVALRARQLLGD